MPSKTIASLFLLLLCISFSSSQFLITVEGVPQEDSRECDLERPCHDGFFCLNSQCLPNLESELSDTPNIQVIPGKEVAKAKNPKTRPSPFVP